MNQEQLLERILLNMKYDSRKTLSENQQNLSDEKVISTIDIFGKPLEFYGKTITTLGQELKRFTSGISSDLENNYYRPKDINQLIFKKCKASVNFNEFNYKNELQACMISNQSAMLSLKQEAPFSIKSGNKMYYLHFDCGQYEKNLVRTYKQFTKFYSLPCEKDNLENVGYINWEKDEWLKTRNFYQKKPTKITPENKKEDAVQNLQSFEISTPKKVASTNNKNQDYNIKNPGGGAEISSQIPQKGKGKEGSDEMTLELN